MDSQIIAANGKVYNMSPITLGDMNKFRSYCQFREWHLLYEVKDQFPEDQIQPLLTSKLEECAKKPVTAELIDELSFSTDGAIYLIWLSLSRNHDNITRKEVADLVTVKTLNDVVERLFLISGFITPGKPSKPTESKKKTSR